MKKTIIISILLFLSLTSVRANDGVVALPDSLGEFLYELFINRAALEQPQIEVSKGVGDYVFEHPIHAWNNILAEASKLGLTPDNTTYDRVYYRIWNSETLFTTTQNNVTRCVVYVGMKHGDDILAFSVGVFWDNGTWLIQTIEPTLSTFKENGYGEYNFRPLNSEIGLDEEEPVEVADAVTVEMEAEPESKIADIEAVEGVMVGEIDVELNDSFVSTVKLNNPVVTSPLVFVDDIYKKLIIDQIPVEEAADFFISEEEYNQAVAPLEKAKLERIFAKEDLSDSDLVELKEIYNNPYAQYSKDLSSAWNELPASAEMQFQIEDLKTLKWDHRETTISNWSDDGDTNIQLEVNIEFEQGQNSGGMRFMAILINEQWKLSFLQEFLYGISQTVESETEY